MEESFELRVKRLFGSQLFEKVPRSSFPATSWSVVDGEVERREWNRERGLGPDRSEDPCSSAFSEGVCFAKKRSSRKGSAKDFELDDDEIDDDDDVEGISEVDVKEEGGGGDDHGEETEIRSSIGLDPTLDNEDEEDEFDRAAEGRDASTERLYMRDIKNHGPHLNYYSIFEDVEDDPYDGPHHIRKDPRADHLAASMRIEEDQKAAQNCKDGVSVEDVKLKPILKRKEQLQDDSKPKKRVRFDNPSKSPDNDPNSAIPNESSTVPDYLKNPAKYTRYSFDAYDDSDFANKGAFEDFRNLLHGKSNREQLEQLMSDELPKSIAFNPRRKSMDAMRVCDDSRDVPEIDLAVSRSTSIAVGESFEVGGGRIEEDVEEETPMDMETPAEDGRAASSRRERKYRSTAYADV